MLSYLFFTGLADALNEVGYWGKGEKFAVREKVKNKLKLTWKKWIEEPSTCPIIICWSDTLGNNTQWSKVVSWVVDLLGGIVAGTKTCIF